MGDAMLLAKRRVMASTLASFEIFAIARGFPPIEAWTRHVRVIHLVWLAALP